MPTSHNGLWESVTDFQNLHRAYVSARRGKRYKPEVMNYSEHLEENLITAQNELIWKTWRPGAWRTFTVHEPKERTITAPPFSDRVVHHALVNVVEPLFERKFISDSYACRLGRGTHKAHSRMLSVLRRETHKHGRVYVLKTDIHSYFPSIDHEVLLRVIRRTIRDKDVLWLMERIVKGCGFEGRGVPIGALTSQLFANIYLDQLDHFVKDELGMKNYVRYMDDAVSIHHDKAVLKDLFGKIRHFVEDRLNLELNPKSRMIPASQGVDFCGYRTWATHTLPRKRNVRRAKRRLRGLVRAYRAGRIPIETLDASWQSLVGYMRHCSGHRTLLEIRDVIRQDLRKEVIP